MLVCQKCGSQQPENAAFCDECGAALGNVPSAMPYGRGVPSMSSAPTASTAQRTLVCFSCGAHLDTDSLFCDMCGVRVPAASSSPPSQPQGYPSPSNVPPPPPVYRPIGSRSAYLVVQKTNVMVPFPQGKSELIIGRRDPISNLFPDVDLTDCGGDKLGVSRQHARIFFQGNQAYVEDRNSSNHTYVNGQQLQPWQPYLLNHGDEVWFGKLKLNFYL